MKHWINQVKEDRRNERNFDTHSRRRLGNLVGVNDHSIQAEL